MCSVETGGRSFSMAYGSYATTATLTEVTSETWQVSWLACREQEHARGAHRGDEKHEGSTPGTEISMMRNTEITPHSHRRLSQHSDHGLRSDKNAFKACQNPRQPVNLACISLFTSAITACACLSSVHAAACHRLNPPRELDVGPRISPAHCSDVHSTCSFARFP